MSRNFREKKLNESLAYQEFCAIVSEEESWLAEKTAVQQSEDFGDSLGAVQVLNYRFFVVSLYSIMYMYLCC